MAGITVVSSLVSENTQKAPGDKLASIFDSTVATPLFQGLVGGGRGWGSMGNTGMLKKPREPSLNCPT